MAQIIGRHVAVDLTDFIAKLGIAEEEADETLYWLELAVAAKLITMTDAAPLIKEADELTAIFTASRKTARKNKN